MKSMSEAKEKPLVTLAVNNEADVVMARRRARQIAYLLGFDLHDQTRISTAVSEITRNALVHANGGRLSFLLDDSQSPYSFVTIVTDQGGGIENQHIILSNQSQQTGLVGASKLVDKFTVETSSSGTRVRLQKNLAPRLPFSASEINELANSLAKIASVSPLDEVHQQNQELLSALEQLSKKQSMLDGLNAELQEKNKSLRDLNQEMQKLNESLEKKVAERTAELLEANSFLKGARDEAVMASALKSQFVSNISHEIRTPMSGILGMAELLATDPEISETCKEMAETIREAGHNLMVIVNDLLDFSKLEAGKMDLENVSVKVETLVEEVVFAIRPTVIAKGLKLNFAVDPAVPEVLYGDPQRIRQALHNLAQNAVKFTDTGEIEIAADMQSSNEDLAVIRFTVRDTGIGINNETQSRLFEPFVQGDGTTTRKYGGTGLGLSIVKRFVDLMLGTVGVQSTEGVGSSFWFAVPLRLSQNV